MVSVLSQAGRVSELEFEKNTRAERRSEFLGDQLGVQFDDRLKPSPAHEAWRCAEDSHHLSRLRRAPRHRDRERVAEVKGRDQAGAVSVARTGAIDYG